MVLGRHGRNHRLGAGEYSFGPVEVGARSESCQIIAARWLLMSESQHCRAGEDLPHQCFMIADQSQGAGRHECSEKRFDSYDTSQLLEDSSDIKTFSSKAAREIGRAHV